MVRRQALGWLGAAVCSVALVVAGGLILSSVAVHRYLQASHSEMQRGEVPEAGTTPAPGELATLKRAVSALAAMPGVETATSTLDTGSTPDPAASSVTRGDAAAMAAKTVSYVITVTMAPDATTEQSADAVFTMTQELQNGRVDLELTMPAAAGRAASVIDYRNAFDTPVPRSTVESVSHAVAVAAAVPGVSSVHVTVPYTWNLASGDLTVEMAPDESGQSSALRSALAHTALSGARWVSPSAAPGSPSAPATKSKRSGKASQPAAPSRAPSMTATPSTPSAAKPTKTPQPTPTSAATPTKTPAPTRSSD